MASIGSITATQAAQDLRRRNLLARVERIDTTLKARFRNWAHDSYFHTFFLAWGELSEHLSEGYFLTKSCRTCDGLIKVVCFQWDALKTAQPIPTMKIREIDGLLTDLFMHVTESE